VVKSLAGPLHVRVVLTVSGRSLTIDADTDRTRPANNLGMTVSGAQQMEVRVIGADLFIKQAGLSRKPWLRVDLHRLPLTSSLLGLIDVRSNLAPVTGVTTVRQTGPGTFEGTLNLEEASAKAPNAAVRSEVNKLLTEAATPTAVPFRAGVDTDGRLVKFDYDIVTNAGAGLVLARITLTKFGTPIALSAPPSGQTEKAADEVYKRL
jgi:hypothetical protein